MALEAQEALLNDYCLGCHDEDGKAGGLSLQDFHPSEAERQPDVAEKMIRKLRAGMMPPPTAPKRPDAAAVAGFVAALEARIDDAAATAPSPGWRPFQRLNRVEYARAIHDLLALDVDVNAFLPPDTISNGFDNVADAQTFSPALMEGYLRAASRVTALAIGDPDASPSEASYKLPKTASQLHRADGAPLGTRGGISVVHTFAADGDYVFRMEMFAEPLGILYGSTAKGEQLDISIDGARVALLEIDPRMTEEKTGLSLKTPSVHVTAGPHRVTAAFVQRFEGPINDLIAPIDHTMADTEIGTAVGITTLPHLRSLNIVGPYRVTGVSDTPSRRRIFSCRPTTLAEEMPCAREIVKALATRAYRGAVPERHLERLMEFYRQGRSPDAGRGPAHTAASPDGGRVLSDRAVSPDVGRVVSDRAVSPDVGRVLLDPAATGSFEAGIANALEAILASPQFLFKLEPPPARLKAGATYRIGDVELASRLSFFVWGSAPDVELLTLANEHRLAVPATLDAQVRRMLADRRSQALSTRFAAQWLRLQDLEKVTPDPIQYPYYDRTLEDALKRETELFFDSLVREDRSVLDLLTADYTFVNERVARHYGIANVTGSEFRRVSLPDYRRGVLGHGSILTLTSNPDRTSPVQRGKWIMEVLLGTPPPPPPPNVPPLDATSASAAGKVLSVRQRMEEHRANPACNSCHRVIDPLGLALENFDATGRWRIRDGADPVDANGVLYDGTAMAGPAGLQNALLKHQDLFLRTFTSDLMTYALGRRVEYFDQPAIRAIVRKAEQNGNRMSSYILGIVNSPAFQFAKSAELKTEE